MMFEIKASRADIKDSQMRALYYCHSLIVEVWVSIDLVWC